MKKESSDLLQGTLDLLILKLLRHQKMHGWGISQKLTLISEEVLNIKEGSLYPALHRLERKGWINAEWGISENNRRAKYYKITQDGISQLEAETAQWSLFVNAVSLVLNYND